MSNASSVQVRASVATPVIDGDRIRSFWPCRLELLCDEETLG